MVTYYPKSSTVDVASVKFFVPLEKLPQHVKTSYYANEILLTSVGRRKFLYFSFLRHYEYEANKKADYRTNKFAYWRKRVLHVSRK